MEILKTLTVTAAIIFIPVMGFTQGASVGFGNAAINPDEPVEITADELTVDQTSGSAIFVGNVVAGQAQLRLSAGTVKVQYAVENGENTGVIDKLVASGGVTLVNGGEAAESREAVYSIATGQIEMTGDVLLTQGVNALSGDKLIVDVAAGTGRMVGRVKTVFKTGGNN